MKTNFELVTELQGLIRRDFTLKDKTLVNPTVANSILDGEFVFMDGSTPNTISRANPAGPGWVVFMEKGRFDVQALSKLTVLYGPTYEADTLIMTPGGISIGTPLEIGTLSYTDGQTRTGLVAHSAGVVIGYATRVPSLNGNKLRFIQTLF